MIRSGIRPGVFINEKRPEFSPLSYDSRSRITESYIGRQSGTGCADHHSHEDLRKKLCQSSVSCAILVEPGDFNMGFIFRKSVNLGPIRLNFGKNGIGVSTGIPGLRIGRNAKGKTYGSAGVPGTGMSWRTTSGSQHGPAKTAGSGCLLMILAGLLLGMLLLVLT